MPVKQQRNPKAKERAALAAELATDRTRRRPTDLKAQVGYLEADLAEANSLIATLTKQRDDALKALNSRANYKRTLQTLDETLAQTDAAVKTIRRIFGALSGAPAQDW